MKFLEVNLSDLPLLAPEGIPHFVLWSKEVDGLDMKSRYSIRFICSSEHKWQVKDIQQLAELKQVSVLFM